MSTALPTYGPPDGDLELDVIARLIHEAFASTPAPSREWMSPIPPEDWRVWRTADGPVGTFNFVPMGQWFGGRRVRSAGISAVAVDPTARGLGVGRNMMIAALRELRESGCPLSALYPATQGLYRRVGFAQAGERFEIHIPPEALPLGDRTLPARRLEPSEFPEVERLYRAFAPAHPGFIDRTERHWQRLRLNKGETATVYGFGPPGGLEAYLFVVRRQLPSGWLELRVDDLAYLTAKGASRLLTFLADHASIAEGVCWPGPPSEPLLAFAKEQSFRLALTRSNVWMERIVDVPAALEARGFPASATGTLDLAVEDALLPENAGAWRLEVSSGRARVRRGGDGRLKLNVAALAPLYTGYRSATALSHIGQLAADADSLELADGLFAGPAPSARDRY